MGLDYRNINTLWSSVLVETLARLGLERAVLCPGSRCTPLTVAFAAHPQIEAIPVLDERSAAFFALGLARRSHRPVVLVCTSGTAGANFYPAVIEADESQVPLIILTADRPPELRHCQAGQAIDQHKLYGHFPRWYHELMVPTAIPSHLATLRQTMMQAWQRAQLPLPGVVHLNCPFRDPLAPTPESGQAALAKLEPDFFDHVAIASTTTRTAPRLPAADALNQVWSQWYTATTGLIIAGPAQPTKPETYCKAIARLSQTLNWPVLAEALSPLRNYADLNPNLITTYDWILRQSQRATQLQPEQVIQLGPLPTSKVLRQWLAAGQAQRWVIDPGDRSVDPLHGHTIQLSTTIEAIAALVGETKLINGLGRPQWSKQITRRDYGQTWLKLDQQVRHWLTTQLTLPEPMIEPQIADILSRQLPVGTPLFIANSMPVRDLEWFWQPGDRRIQPYFNRGANGIDGTLSTALGVAHAHVPSVLLTGDLALLHDTNGLLIRPHFQGNLTIIVINNHGGGIFEMLPIAQFNPPFEPFFTTPQAVDLAALCTAYGVEYQQITTTTALATALQTTLTAAVTPGLRLWEIPVNRKVDMNWRKQMFQVAANTNWSSSA